MNVLPIQQIPLYSLYDVAWAEYRCVHVGDPEALVVYWLSVQPSDVVPLRIAVHSDTASNPFDSAILWKERIVIGVGVTGYLHFISFNAQTIATYELGSEGCYFCGFSAYEDFLLVASGRGLSYFTCGATRLWQTTPLAVDGVRVSCVNDEIVYREGEQNPPGGWAPFAVSLASGLISDTPKAYKQ